MKGETCREGVRYVLALYRFEAVKCCFSFNQFFRYLCSKRSRHSLLTLHWARTNIKQYWNNWLFTFLTQLSTEDGSRRWSDVTKLVKQTVTNCSSSSRQNRLPSWRICFAGCKMFLHNILRSFILILFWSLLLIIMHANMAQYGRHGNALSTTTTAADWNAYPKTTQKQTLDVQNLIIKQTL